MSSGQYDNNTQGLSSSVPDTQTPIEGYLIAFNVLYISALVLLVVVLLTAILSPRVQRSSLWYSFIVCWILYSLSFLLNVSYQRGPLPPHGLCLGQAALIYASPAMTSFACLGLVGQLYSTIKMGDDSEGSTIVRLLHIAPFTAYILVTVECLVFGIGHPEAVIRDLSGMYCNFTSGTGRTTAMTLIIPCSLCVLWLYVRIFTTIRKNAINVRGPLFSVQGISWPVIVRVVSFCFLPMIALVLSLFLYIKNDWEVANSSKVNLVSAAVPFVCAVLFGSQKDIIHAWMNAFRRSPPSPPCPTCGCTSSHK
ncbi:hypothetical protein BDZ89DRAFT_1167326 [Hymenopellis radicata]|nr:hypothetical protein BDZ89DRAFT_1167326 [Hymenopellis radicata]